MINSPLNNIISKLDRVIKKENRFKISTGIFYTLSAFIASFTIFSLFETLFNFNSTTRTVLFFVICFSVIGTFTFLLVIPFFQFQFQLKNEKFFKAAREVGNYFPQIGDKLLNVLQLVNSSDSNNIYSSDLIHAALNETEKNFKDIDFEQSIENYSFRKSLSFFSASLIISFLFFFFTPGLIEAGKRIIQFSKDFEPPARFYFEVTPGDAKITKGDNFSLKVKVIGESFRKINLHFGEEGIEVYDDQELHADSSGIFNFNFISPLRSFYYFVSADEVKSKKFFVEVVNRPIIKNLSLKITPPAYSKLPIQLTEDNGDISTLFGSSVELQLSASKNLSKAKLVFGDTTQIGLSIDKNRASLKFKPTRNNTYKIFIYDEDGNENLNPVEYQIRLTMDNPPSILLLKPTRTVNLSDDMRLSTLVKIKDDFGFSRLTLNYRLSYSRYQKPQDEFEKMDIPFSPTAESDVAFIWNLTPLNLVTDDAVAYYFEVFDNDNVSGPKSARTEIMTVRVPSLEEILAESNRTQNNAITEMQQTLKESEELKKDIEELDRDLKSAREKLTWEEQKKVEEILRKQDNLQKRVENIQEQLNNLQEKLNENKLLSPETLQKYMELQELFNQLSSEEMKAAMQKLNEALKNISKQMLQEALKNFQFNEEMFRASLERTIELLKRVQIEQKVDEISKRIEEMMKQQDELSNKLQNTNPDDQKSLQNLSEQQKQLSKELDDLQKQLEELEKKMSEFPKEMPDEDLRKMMDEFANENPSQCSNQASKEMKEGQLSKAGKNQQNVKNSLSKIQKGMSQLKQQMMQNQMMMALNQMRKIVNELLELSKKQESIKNKTQNIDPNSQKLNEMAQNQSDLRDDLGKIINQLIELSNKTFAVTPEMGKAVGKANAEMAQALGNFKNRNNFGALQNQINSMAALNEAASLIQEMMQNMMQGGQGGGMMSFMQRLQQMSQQQLNLNNLTQMLGQGKLTMEQLSQLQRLAAEQEMVRKSLEELNREIRESGQGSRMLGDLDDAIKKMEEVIREMKQNNINDDVVQKQEKILTRLLDAQRSINERDYEKRRESRPGEDLPKRQPTEIDLSTQEGRDKLREDLLRALEEGYAKDYEVLIRKYFEALQKEIK